VWFLGGWLLVAGPVYQAAIELGEEQFERDEIDRASDAAEPLGRVSPWWWLIPPVGYVLNHRRRQEWRVRTMHALTRAQLEQFVSFVSKATGWMFIAAGASLIAIKETWELHEAYEWPVAIFWGLVVIMLVLCALNTVVRVQRAHTLLNATPPHA
jgi:hypothetical protein